MDGCKAFGWGQFSREQAAVRVISRHLVGKVDGVRSNLIHWNTRCFKRRYVCIETVWELSQLKQKAHKRIFCFYSLCFCCDFRHATDSLAVWCPSVVQRLVMDATFAIGLMVLVSSHVTGLRLSLAHIWMPNSISLPSRVLRLLPTLIPYLPPQHC